MIVKRFYHNGRADFLAETDEDRKLEVGDLIKVEFLTFQIKGKYYSPNGYLYEGYQFDLNSIPEAKLPF